MVMGLSNSVDLAFLKQFGLGFDFGATSGFGPPGKLLSLNQSDEIFGAKPVI